MKSYGFGYTKKKKKKDLAKWIDVQREERAAMSKRAIEQMCE